MRIGLLSDTHGYLDEAILTHFDACDEVWHAGDLGAEVYERLAGFRKLRAVFGNIDGDDLRTQIPEDLDWQCEEVQLYMTHIGGYPGRYDARAKRHIEMQKPQVFICGHSHIPRVMRDPRMQLLHLNPGACGNAGWHTTRTVLRFSLEAGKVGNVELIELGKRGRRVGS